MSAEGDRPRMRPDRRGHVGHVRHHVPEHRAAVHAQRGRRRAVVGVAFHRLGRAGQRDVVEGHDRHAGRSRRQVSPQPRQLGLVDVAVVPEVGDVDGVESHEVHAAARERVVVRPQPRAIHALAVERMRGAHERLKTLDTEVLVVAGHAPHGHRERRRFGLVHRVVAGRLGLAHAQGIAHQIAGHQHEIDAACLGDATHATQAVDALAAGVRIRGMEERERGRRRPPRQPERQAVPRRAPESTARHVALRHRHEHHAGADRR